MANKYNARKTNVNGKKFDSRKEADRYVVLKAMERSGLISGLKTQVRYDLIPTQKVDGKVVERAVYYVADFVYKDRNGNLIVEDVKGYRNPQSAGYAKYVIKRKLMLWEYGIKVVEL